MSWSTELCAHYGVSRLADLSATAMILPEFYPKGRLLWTVKRLDALTADQRKRVCEELREIYLKEGSQAYLIHLQTVVKAQGRQSNADAMKQGAIIPNAGGMPKGMANRVANLRA